MFGSRVNYSSILDELAPWILDDSRQVFDPPAWYGVASTMLCGGRGDPLPSWRSFLVQSGIKVTRELGVSLCDKSRGSRRDLVTDKQYS